MRPLSEFRAELRSRAEEQGSPPLTEERRAEIRDAFYTNLGKVSPAAFAVVERDWPETLAAMKREDPLRFG